MSFLFFDAQPEVQRPTLLGDGFLYCILSANLSGPQTPSGFPWTPSAGRGFPYHISSPSDWHSNSTGTWLPSWLRYIIIQRPHDRPLDLWNRMFNRHQAEITVMQFTGHSLPVRQSMSVLWEFFLARPISSANFLAISSHNCHWNMSPPSGGSPWNGIFGRVKRSKYNIRAQCDLMMMMMIKIIHHIQSQCFIRVLCALNFIKYE